MTRSAIQLVDELGAAGRISSIEAKSLRDGLTTARLTGPEVRFELDASGFLVAIYRLTGEISFVSRSVAAAAAGIPCVVTSMADLFALFDNMGARRALGKFYDGMDGTPYQILTDWKRHGSIPPKHWPPLIAAARGIGLELDEALLVRIHLAAPAEERAP